MRQPQANKTHYSFFKYGYEERFISHYWQLHEVLKEGPSSILEIGVGDHFLGNFIKSNTDIAYTSIDIAEDLNPDVVGDITALPFPDASFDAVCAFEVLEHLPFDKFEIAISEILRVSRRRVLISLPHFGPTFSFELKIPLLPKTRMALKIPFPKRHKFNGQHFWEIGKRGYSTALIRKILSAHGTLTRDFIPYGSPYHHFFILNKPS